MPTYLWRARYSVSGLAGLKKDGATGRYKVVSEMIEGAGGKIVSFYFSFGDVDAIIIAEFPDNVSAARVAMAVSAAGGVSVETTVLLTRDEVDQALQGDVNYRPPGG